MKRSSTAASGRPELAEVVPWVTHSTSRGQHKVVNQERIGIEGERHVSAHLRYPARDERVAAAVYEQRLDVGRRA